MNIRVNCLYMEIMGFPNMASKPLYMVTLLVIIRLLILLLRHLRGFLSFRMFSSHATSPPNYHSPTRQDGQTTK
jgi:hypothetical protein